MQYGVLIDRNTQSTQNSEMTANRRTSRKPTPTHILNNKFPAHWPRLTW